MELVHQPLESFGLLDGIEVLPLDVLDQRKLQDLRFRNFLDQDGNLFYASLLSGPPSSFPGNKFKGAPLPPDNQRLENSFFPDGTHQLLKLAIPKGLPGLKRIGLNLLDPANLKSFFSFKLRRRLFRDQRSQTFSQRLASTQQFQPLFICLDS